MILYGTSFGSVGAHNVVTSIHRDGHRVSGVILDSGIPFRRISAMYNSGCRINPDDGGVAQDDITNFNPHPVLDRMGKGVQESENNLFHQQMQWGDWLSPYLIMHSSNGWTTCGTTVVNNATTDFDDDEPITAAGYELMYSEAADAHATAFQANDPVALLSEYSEQCVARTVPTPAQCVASIDPNNAQLVNQCCDNHVSTNTDVKTKNLYLDPSHPFYDNVTATMKWVENAILPTPKPELGPL